MTLSAVGQEAYMKLAASGRYLNVHSCCATADIADRSMLICSPVCSHSYDTFDGFKTADELTFYLRDGAKGGWGVGTYRGTRR